MININDNVHEGRDYLADRYHHYFNDTKSVPHVLEMDGDVVCIILQYFYNFMIMSYLYLYTEYLYIYSTEECK